MTLDPVLDVALRAGLAALLASTALAKLRDLGGFAAAVAGYRLLPDRLAGLAAVGFVAAELALAAGLWLAPLREIAGFGAAALFALYGAAIGVNLARGRRDIDCGCGGPLGRQALSGGLVARNALLSAAALATALPAAPRAWTWLDAIAALAALLTAALLYAATNRLLARPVVLG